MDLKQLLVLVRRRWITIAVVVAMALGVSAAISLTTTPRYQSKARIFISADVSTSTDALAGSTFAAARVKSYASLATSQELLSRVSKALNHRQSADQLAGKITATVEQDTVIIALRVRDTDPRLAQQIADTEADQLTRYIGSLEQRPRKSEAPVKATVVDKASYDPYPVAPRTSLNLLVAAILGLLLGLTLAAVRELLDNTVKHPSDLAGVLDAPLLATFQYDGGVPKHPLITEGAANSPRSEAFRVLRTNIQFLDLDSPPRAVVVTSSGPGEGKTSIAMNLAISMAQTGQSVLLVDCDLRRPQVATTLQLESSVGLITVLLGRAPLEECLQHHNASGVDVLASGPIPPNPAEVLQSETARKLLDRLSTMYDLVIIDAPPLLPVADAAVLAQEADGAILVVRHGHTTKAEVAAAHDRLTGVGGRILGVTVNMTPKRSRRGYGYGYGYGYGKASSVTPAR